MSHTFHCPLFPNSFSLYFVPTDIPLSTFMPCVYIHAYTYEHTHMHTYILCVYICYTHERNAHLSLWVWHISVNIMLSSSIYFLQHYFNILYSCIKFHCVYLLLFYTVICSLIELCRIENLLHNKDLVRWIDSLQNGRYYLPTINETGD